ncbi:MAG: DUF937 domain-containing protein [Spirochaetales bacterium]|nr:DUF937 domain-containing protein [Spirochaetales bacterium]
MSFLDRLVGLANEIGKKEGARPDLLDGVIKLVREKGIRGLAEDFRSRGLGDLASSWIGPGENKPISTDQIKAILGHERLQDLARRAGVSQENASKFFSEILPGLVDRLTPEGRPPDDDPAGESTAPDGKPVS